VLEVLSVERYSSAAVDVNVVSYTCD